MSGSVRLPPSEWFNIELFGSHVERKSEAFPDDSGGPRLAVNREKTLRDSIDEIYGAACGGGDVRTVRFDAVLSRYDRREHDDNAAVDAGVRFPVPAFTSDTEFRRDNATVSATHEYGNIGQRGGRLRAPERRGQPDQRRRLLSAPARRR